MAFADGVLGPGNHLLRIDDAGRDHDAAGEKLLRQFADFGALVKDGLLGFFGSGNLVFSVVAEPQQLRALPPHQESGLGETWLMGGGHGYITCEDSNSSRPAVRAGHSLLTYKSPQIFPAV